MSKNEPFGPKALIISFRLVSTKFKALLKNDSFPQSWEKLFYYIILALLESYYIRFEIPIYFSWVSYEEVVDALCINHGNLKPCLTCGADVKVKIDVTRNLHKGLRHI